MKNLLHNKDSYRESFSSIINEDVTNSNAFQRTSIHFNVCRNIGAVINTKKTHQTVRINVWLTHGLAHSVVCLISIETSVFVLPSSPRKQ